MAIRNVAAALALIATPALAAPPPAAPASTSSRAEKRAMLDALLARRAQLQATQGSRKNKAEALAFLDRQIAQVRKTLGR